MWGAALQPTDARRLVKLVRCSPSARDTGVFSPNMTSIPLFLNERDFSEAVSSLLCSERTHAFTGPVAHEGARARSNDLQTKLFQQSQQSPPPHQRGAWDFLLDYCRRQRRSAHSGARAIS